MMATEANSGNITAISLPSDHNNELINTSKELPKSCEIISENTAPKDEDSKHDLDLLETKINSAAGSIYGGSDSDTLKLEISKVGSEDKGHHRNISTVKKPTSFKPVSVNKKFLAAKISISSTTSKLGDKIITGSTSAQVTPLVGGNSTRPRLVAKSGPGLSTVPRTTISQNGAKAGGAPDASAVWNKNRPAPPPEPKRYSDEELKIRYGIHLARRLQSDDSGKQANWADIDDDDDYDWALNTMEWADGTKSTLPPADERPVPTSSQPVTESTVSNEKESESTKPRSPTRTKLPASPTVKTAGFSGRAGLILKGNAEKLNAITKSTGPPNVTKSPWAPLPPVEKVAPIVNEAPQPQQPRQNRLSQKDGYDYNNVTLFPAKEIAADDFSRSWRDGSSASRELYNAQSGRYEPANDKRRGSVRNDSRPHQPFVLQRSNQDNPAEPSPAFQTHRSGGQDRYDRRRNSSNVSLGSEKISRRMSRGDVPSGHEVLAVQRVSLNTSVDEPASPSNSSISAQQPQQRNNQNQTWQSRVSSMTSYHSPQQKQGQAIAMDTTQGDCQKQTPSIAYEDPIELQRKTMLIKRELAISRRREQEEREAAEKEERIRIKLASMGPSPEKIKKETINQDKSGAPQTQTALPNKKNSKETNNVVSEVIKSNTDILESKEKFSLANTIESSSMGKNSSDTKSNNSHISQSNSPQNQISQSWHTNNTDRFKPWAPAPSQQSSSRNVWGPPTNDRTLGNGTFNPELIRLPEISSHSSPIGPLTSNRGNSHGQSPDYSSRPAPIGPPNRRQVHSLSQESNIRSAVATSGWGSLPNKIAEEDARLAKRQEIEITRARNLREKGVLIDQPPPVLHDTWRQISMKENGNRSKTKSSDMTIHNEQPVPWRDNEETTRKENLEDQETIQRRSLEKIGTQQKFSDAWKVSNFNAPPTRDSRFFPNTKDIRVILEDQNSLHGRPESPSPPPPTQQGHPAYDGDVAHPQVSLPRPPPIVRLPPPNVVTGIGPPKPTSFAAVVATPALPIVHRNTSRIQSRTSQSREIHREEPVAGNWQDKINSLIGRKCSPSKPQSMAVDSFSKKALELPNQRKSATVSLPSLVSGDLAIENGSVETKPASEVCFEEQEMGSLPLVKIPMKLPAAAWDLAPSPKALPKKFLLQQSTSIEAITFPQQITNNSLSFVIKVPGQLESKKILTYMNKQRNNSKRSGTRLSSKSRNIISSQHRVRGRAVISSFPSSNLEHAAAHSDLGLSNRGRGRRHSSSWKRNSITPVQS